MTDRFESGQTYVLSGTVTSRYYPECPFEEQRQTHTYTIRIPPTVPPTECVYLEDAMVVRCNVTGPTYTIFMKKEGRRGIC